MTHKHVALCWLSIAAALSPPTARVSQLARRHAGVQPRVTRRSDGQTTSTHCRSTAGDDAQHALPRRAALALAAFCAAPASAAESLRDALAARDANRLTKPFYSIPPGPTTFPDWLEGRWRCSATFQGFQFPNEKISKQRVVAETDLPGFTKLSIARFGDVGREKTEFDLNFVRRGDKVIEDYGNNVANALSAHVDKPDLVKSVAWDAANPNRMTMSLKEGGRNGERIEIFVNSRRSEALEGDIFLNSESIRQMTMGPPTLQNPTTPRVVIGEYQHFWTWRKDGDGARCNVLTAVYAVPGGFGFEEAFDKPLVMYSHNLRLTRV